MKEAWIPPTSGLTPRTATLRLQQRAPDFYQSLPDVEIEAPEAISTLALSPSARAWLEQQAIPYPFKNNAERIAQIYGPVAIPQKVWNPLLERGANDEAEREAAIRVVEEQRKIAEFGDPLLQAMELFMAPVVALDLTHPEGPYVYLYGLNRWSPAYTPAALSWPIADEMFDPADDIKEEDRPFALAVILSSLHEVGIDIVGDLTSQELEWVLESHKRVARVVIPRFLLNEPIGVLRSPLAKMPMQELRQWMSDHHPQHHFLPRKFPQIDLPAALELATQAPPWAPCSSSDPHQCLAETAQTGIAYWYLRAVIYRSASQRRAPGFQAYHAFPAFPGHPAAKVLSALPPLIPQQLNLARTEDPTLDADMESWRIHLLPPEPHLS